MGRMHLMEFCSLQGRAISWWGTKPWEEAEEGFLQVVCVLGEKHPQLVHGCVSALPPQDVLCQDRLERWLWITGCPGQAAVLDCKGTASLVGGRKDRETVLWVKVAWKN